MDNKLKYVSPRNKRSKGADVLRRKAMEGARIEREINRLATLKQDLVKEKYETGKISVDLNSAIQYKIELENKLKRNYFVALRTFLFGTFKSEIKTLKDLKQQIDTKNEQLWNQNSKINRMEQEIERVTDNLNKLVQDDKPSIKKKMSLQLGRGKVGTSQASTQKTTLKDTVENAERKAIGSPSSQTRAHHSKEMSR